VARQNPHVLDSAAFEYPTEMNLAAARVFASVVVVDEGIELPASDQPPWRLQWRLFTPLLLPSIPCTGLPPKRIR
jgi:hypothetical protein